MDDVLGEQTLFGAAWRYRWIALSIAVFVAGLGYLYSIVRPPSVSYTARAQLVVQAGTSGLDLGTSVSPQRFVSNQVAVLQSGAVAELASSLAAEADPPADVMPEEVSAGLSVFASSSADLIQLAYTADDPDTAVAVVNAVVDAYRQLLSSERSASTSSVLERIDAELEALNERANSLSNDIRFELAKDSDLVALGRQYEDAIAEVVALNEELQRAEGNRLDEVRARLADVRSFISVYQAIQGIGRSNPDLDALQAELNQVLERKAALLDRRDNVTVDAEMAPDTIAFESIARTAVPTGGSGPGRVLAVSLVLGLLTGLGTAYLLGTRRNVFHDRLEAEQVLDAPLLAEIPEFGDEGLDTNLPVRDQPRSAAAEAFRFAATSVELKMLNRGVKMVAVLSATLGAGKSTVLANLALASARKGTRVLLVDADFGNQALTALLRDDGVIPSGGDELPRGLTDLVSGDAEFGDAVMAIEAAPGVEVYLLGRGRQPVAAAELVRSRHVRELFGAMRDEFDVVFVDAPPLLQVAYASTLASYADSAMLVVEHGGSVSQVREARARLDLIDVPIGGYVYNRSPLRKEMTFTEGSMADILGDLGLLEASQKQADAE